MPTFPLLVTPDPTDADARQVLLDVRVGPAADDVQRMLLDTGAARSAVLATSAVAALPRVPAKEDGRALSGAAIAAERVVLPEVALGAHVLATGIEANLLPADAMRPGLLGADALQGHRVHLRFSEGVLELDGERPAGAFLLELERPGNAPWVEVRAHGLHTRACLDTGAGVTVVDLGFALAHPDAVEIGAPVADGTDAAGAAVPSRRGRLAPLRVGGVELPATDVAVVDLSGPNATLPWPLTIVLGLPLISRADWFLDFPGNAWAVTAASR